MTRPDPDRLSEMQKSFFFLGRGTTLPQTLPQCGGDSAGRGTLLRWLRCFDPRAPTATALQLGAPFANL